MSITREFFSIENEDPILPGQVGVQRALYVLKNVREELLADTTSLKRGTTRRPMDRRDFGRTLAGAAAGATLSSIAVRGQIARP